MKQVALIALALVYPAFAIAQSAPDRVPIADSDSSFLVKTTSSMSTSSKPGDLVTGIVIDPGPLRGAEVKGTVNRADHSILSFSLNKVLVGGRSYSVQSKLLSVRNSHGNQGQDDLDQRIRIEGGNITAYGTTTALNEGAEVGFSVWKKQ